MKEQKMAILVVEDSVTNRQILIHLLRKLGFSVIEAVDGREALNTLKNPPEGVKIEAILSDFTMPNIDGLTLLQEVRKTLKMNDIPFVFVTAVSDKQKIIHSKTFSSQGSLLKPVTFERLKNKMTEIFPHINLSIAG